MICFDLQVGDCQKSVIRMAAKVMSDIIKWLTPGVAFSPFVCIFMQITSDPMRIAKLLFDFKVVSGDFPLGSTYLQLLVCN